MELTTRQVSVIIASCVRQNFKYEIKLSYVRDGIDKFHYDICEILITGDVWNISNSDKELFKEHNIIYSFVKKQKHWKFCSSG